MNYFGGGIARPTCIQPWEFGIYVLCTLRIKLRIYVCGIPLWGL